MSKPLLICIEDHLCDNRFRVSKNYNDMLFIEKSYKLEFYETDTDYDDGLYKLNINGKTFYDNSNYYVELSDYRNNQIDQIL